MADRELVIVHSTLRSYRKVSIQGRRQTKPVCIRMDLRTGPLVLCRSKASRKRHFLTPVKTIELYSLITTLRHETIHRLT